MTVAVLARSAAAHADEGQVHLLPIELVALLDLGGGHLDAVGHQTVQPLLAEIAPERLLELAAVALRIEDAAQQLAVEAAVLLQLGHPGEGRHELLVGDVEPQVVDLVLDEGRVDQIVECLAAQVRHARQGHAFQELLVPALQHGGLAIEVAARDARIVDLGDDVDGVVPERADAPADEREREEGVQNAVRQGAVKTAQLVQHSASEKPTARPPGLQT